jgi:hypothetical protein
MGEWMYWSTFSWPAHYLEVSGLLHTLPALPSENSVRNRQQTGWAPEPVWKLWGRITWTCQKSDPSLPSPSSLLCRLCHHWESATPTRELRTRGLSLTGHFSTFIIWYLHYYFLHLHCHYSLRLQSPPIRNHSCSQSYRRHFHKHVAFSGRQIKKKSQAPYEDTSTKSSCTSEKYLMSAIHYIPHMLPPFGTYRTIWSFLHPVYNRCVHHSVTHAI